MQSRSVLLPLVLFLTFRAADAGVLVLDDATKPAALGTTAASEQAPNVLGPEDQIRIHVIDMEDIPDKPIRIDPNGNIDLPIIGAIHVAGMTVSELKDRVVAGLKRYVREPMVDVSVVEFHSKPITILGAVNTPGVRQIEGPRTILEAISLAGGLRPDAGSTLTITRRAAQGVLPIKGARKSLDEGYSVASLPVERLMAAQDPAENILVLPNDVITVSTSELIYVIGEVRKPGGFTLHSHETLSVLQALALAEGAQKTAAPQHARILRVKEPGQPRVDLHTDLAAIIDGKSPDIPLQKDDILVIPNNATRNAALRTLETAIQVGTGILIFHR